MSENYKPISNQMELHSIIVTNNWKLANKTVCQPIDCGNSYRSSLGNGQLADTLIAEKTNWPQAASPTWSYNRMHPIHPLFLQLRLLHQSTALYGQLVHLMIPKEIKPHRWKRNWSVVSGQVVAYNGMYRRCVRTYNSLFSTVHLKITFFLLLKTSLKNKDWSLSG